MTNIFKIGKKSSRRKRSRFYAMIGMGISCSLPHHKEELNIFNVRSKLSKLTEFGKFLFQGVSPRLRSDNSNFFSKLF